MRKQLHYGESCLTRPASTVTLRAYSPQSAAGRFDTLIERITIQRFKSVREAELDLARVNMFIGNNGAGKSNVLEAIGVASASVGRGVGDRDLQQKGVRVTPPPLMTSAFPPVDADETAFRLSVRMSGDIDYAVELASSEDGRFLWFVSEKCEHAGNAVFQRTKQSAHLLQDLQFSGLDLDVGIWQQIRSLSSVTTLHAVREALDTLAQYAIYAPQVGSLRGQRGGLTPVASVGVNGEGLPAAVESILIQHSEVADARETELQSNALQLAFLPGWANSVHVGRIDDRLVSRAISGKGEERPMLYFEDKYMEGRKRLLSVYDSSEGTLFLLFVAALLVHRESPRIFALDNADNRLNPSMTSRMIESVIKITKIASSNQLDCGPRQVFLTSHNPTALDAFDLFDNDLRVFVVSRNDAGNTEVTRLEPPESVTRDDWIAMHGGQNLSQLWIDGAIAGALGPAC